MKLIVACDPEGGIGYNNELPWNNIQGDLPRFKELTKGQVVVMGRKTWESLPVKPLPNRMNFIVTSAELIGLPAGTLAVPNLKNFQEFKDAWVIGGAQLINSSWDMIDEIHLTKTLKTYQCDTFIDLEKLQTEFDRQHNEQNIDHIYEIWTRKKVVEEVDIIPLEYFLFPKEEAYWLPASIPNKVEECLFLPVWMPMKEHFEFSKGTYFIKQIAESILHYWKNSNYKKIVFLSYTEAFSVSYIKPMNKIVNYLHKNHRFTLDKFLYVAGAHPTVHNIQKYKELSDTVGIHPIDIILVNYMEMVLNIQDKHVKVDFDQVLTTPRKKLKKFTSLNGVPRLFRVMLTGQLLKHDLIKNSHYTFWFNQKGTASDLSHTYVEMAKKQFPNIAKESVDIMNQHKSSFPMYLYTPVTGKFGQQDVFLYNTSYFSLVAETVFAENKGLTDDIFYDCYDFSEKLFRPIKFKHPFILAARPHSLKVLREYGYKTFHPYINENYDTIENDEDRLLAIVEEVKRLSAFTNDQWLTWQKNIKDVVEHNFHVLNKIGIKTLSSVPKDVE